MAKHELIERLTALPGALLAAESEVLTAEWDRQDAAQNLQRAEDALLLDAERVNGKNAEQRAAQIREATEIERRTLVTLERALMARKTRLHCLQAEHASLRAVARLLAATE